VGNIILSGDDESAQNVMDPLLITASLRGLVEPVQECP